MKTVGVSQKLVTIHKNNRHHVSKNNNLQSDNNKVNHTELSDTFFYRCTVHSDICKVHSPTKALFFLSFLRACCYIQFLLPTHALIN